MSKVKIELTHSIEIDGAKVGVIQLRRPKVRDMLSVEKSVDNDAEKEIQLFANLSELSPDNLLDLDMADYAKLQKAYQDFLS
ncbi:MAG: phage tail assembly protein [Candidatus Thiodiazotropha endolucinida]|nr:phage tail assembly protein [Candidatus Thiodiazotropha taylori]MCW4263388.1 phage tail assembly protein [Candidatus Thiodiazotropha endolucinida]